MNHRSIIVLTSIAAALLVAGCEKAPVSTLSSPVTTGQAGNISDVDVTEHVTTALLQNDLLKATNITVITTKGDVRLTGVLESQKQIDAAIKTALAADGVHAIHDELTLKK